MYQVYKSKRSLSLWQNLFKLNKTSAFEDNWNFSQCTNINYLSLFCPRNVTWGVYWDQMIFYFFVVHFNFNLYFILFFHVKFFLKQYQWFLNSSFTCLDSLLFHPNVNAFGLGQTWLHNTDDPRYFQSFFLRFLSICDQKYSFLLGNILKFINT